jgi:hypothetical protein
MLANYGIDTDDTGFGDEYLRDHWAYGEAPDAFVKWVAQKYDLISKHDMGVEGR